MTPDKNQITECPKCSSALLGEVVTQQPDIVLVCCVNKQCSWTQKFKIEKTGVAN